MGPERRFRVNQVIPFLKTLKNTFYFAIQQKAISGDPDFVLVTCGLFVGLELKGDRGVLAPLQEWKGTQIRRAGGLFIVCSPSNFEEVKNLLRELDEGGTFAKACAKQGKINHTG